MSGFDNETVYATNIDLRGVTPIVGQFKNDGELLIGDATGGVGSTATGLRGRLQEGNGITIEYASGDPSTLTISSTATGAWVFLGDVTASTSASVEFTGLTEQFCMYQVVVKNVAPDTDLVEFLLRTSSTNGQSYDSGASDYDWGQQVSRMQAGGTFHSGDAGDTAIRINGTENDARLGIVANSDISSTINIIDPAETKYTRVLCMSSLTGDDSFGIATYVCGNRLETVAVNAIQFSMSSGNILSGKFALYGLTA